MNNNMLERSALDQRALALTGARRPGAGARAACKTGGHGVAAAWLRRIQRIVEPECDV
jgi:hypothetical protein